MTSIVANAPSSAHPPFTPEGLLAHITALGVNHRVYTHAPVFTVDEANKLEMSMEGAHTRNLFIRDKKENMFLVTLPHHIAVDLKKLSDLLGVARFSFGSPERLWTYLGVTPGSVTPFAILNDTGRRVTLILDKGMMQSELVNFHPLINTMTIGLTPAGLMTILAKSGITPRIVDLTTVAP